MYTSILGAICLQLVYVLSFIQPAAGNVEKTIFVAPPPSTVPAENIAIDDLGLDRLSPTEYTLRTHLNASFPTTDEPHGSESWFYLEDLNPGQRYEVRICWLATQPTSFSLDTYPLQEVISDQSLLPALLKFSDARLAEPSPPSSPRLDGASSLQPPKARLHEHHNFFKQRNEKDSPIDTLTSPQSGSMLFLRIHAAADYFTTNSTLMNHVPPVVADVILDPFLFNVFPRSLVPTALYTVVIAVIAYFVGGFLAKWLTSIVGSSDNSQSDAVSASAKEEIRRVENKKKK